MRRAWATVEVTGWRYTRCWLVGLRRGEWWIGARRSFAMDALEINVFGLTVLIPIERIPRHGRRRRVGK